MREKKEREERRKNIVIRGVRVTGGRERRQWRKY